MRLLLRGAATWEAGVIVPRDVAVVAGRVGEVGEPGTLRGGDAELDLAGRVLLPGFVNGHDHLDFSTFRPLGRPPYASLYEWAADVNAGSHDAAAKEALEVRLVDRLFLGGLRNLLSGVTAVAHHGPYHRSLGRDAFPVRVLARYGFAHSPGLTPQLRRTYRTTDRRIPWMVHAAEGVDERCRCELDRLVEAGVLRHNTVIVHGIGLRPEDARRIAAAKGAVVWCPESNRALYGATAPVAALRAAGVRLGLGSDSPASGVRDPLSNLAAARREGVFGDDELLVLATRGTAEVVRLPAGGFVQGQVADLVAAESLDRLLAGDRTAISLVLVGGRACYGAPGLLKAPRAALMTVDGVPRLLDAGIARRTVGLLRDHPALRSVSWLAGLELGYDGGAVLGGKP